MILIITFIFIVIVLFAVTYKICKDKEVSVKNISFRESMYLTELPIITFFNNNVKLNFLLDTGSNLSHINSSILSNLEYTKLEGSHSVVGIGGKKECGICEMMVKYKNQEFKEDFYITNLDEAFDEVKKESGVQIHGILGNRFFEKYKYIIDFDKFIAYSK